MIEKYLHKINNLFYPFDKTFEVAVIGENEKICAQFVEMCENHIANNELLQYGLEYTYNWTSNEYEIKIGKQDVVRFKFLSPQVLTNSDWDKANITGDILVSIFRLDKYQSFEYSCLWQDIDGFLGKVQRYKKTAIVALINFDFLCNKPITDVEQWKESIDKIYDALQQNKNLDKTYNLNENGQKIIKLIFEMLQRHLNKNTEYTAYRICNFFCYNKTSGFSFGIEEFFSNLLMRLLSFDKLNNYKCQVKK